VRRTLEGVFCRIASPLFLAALFEFYLIIVTVYKYIRLLIKLIPDLLDTVGACGCYCTFRYATQFRNTK